MNNYTNEIILDLFAIHSSAHNVIIRTCREFNAKYPHLNPMNPRKFLRLKNKVITTGNLNPPRNRKKSILNDEETQINVLAYFTAYPKTSIRHASEEIGISFSSVQRILSEHKFHPYSFIRLQKLSEQDFGRRLMFCEDFLLKFQEHGINFLKNIIWSDEAKFSKRGVHNHRNQHFWATENPHLVKQVDNQFQFSVNVFCLLLDDQVKWFIYEENLNGNRYLDIITNIVEEFIDNLPFGRPENLWYQMDGAPAHSTRAVDRKLTMLFEDRWWGNKGPLLWPPRSPDLTPLDFFLWGRIKDVVYQTEPGSKIELVQRINESMISLDPQEIRRATNNAVIRRIELCTNRNGEHIEHLL